MNIDLIMEEDPLLLPTTQASVSTYNQFKWSPNGIRYVGTEKVGKTGTRKFLRKQSKNDGQLEKLKMRKNITNQKENNVVQKEKRFKRNEQEKKFRADMNSLFMTLKELLLLQPGAEVPRDILPESSSLSQIYEENTKSK